MPLYVVRCEKCEVEEEIFMAMRDHGKMPWPQHCGQVMEQVPQAAGLKFARKPGKETGFYTLDHGKRATEDLTVPGKMDRLKREGRIRDPFDDRPKKKPDPKLIEETFGDPTPAELERAGRR